MGDEVRVFLLDDHEVVRRGLKDLLEGAGDLAVVGEASTAAEALARIPRPGPTWPSSTCDSPTATAWRCAGRCAPATPRSSA